MTFVHTPKLSLLALGLLAALSVSAPVAEAADNKPAKSVAKASKPAATRTEHPQAGAEESDCDCKPGDTPYRTDSLPVTPQVRAIFKAASDVDEAGFTALLAQTPDINRYLLDDDTLLAVLLRPNLPKARAGEQDPDNSGQMSDSTRQRLLAAHRALLPARTRMLALLLKAGARPAEFTRSSDLPALHLALLIGTPEIVDLLLQAGADPDQHRYLDNRSALEYALQGALAIRGSGMPDLVSRSDRSAMFLALLKAGAHRPYLALDTGFRKSSADEARHAAEAADSPQEKAKQLAKLAAAPLLVAADYVLWEPLVEMTEGTEVLDAFVRMGSKPPAPAPDQNVLSHAAFAGNVKAVAWLQKQLPRFYGPEEDLAATDISKKLPPVDGWAEAAGWALESPFTAQRPDLFKLLTRIDTDWGINGSSRLDKTYLAGLNSQNRTATFGGSLLARVVASGDAALLDASLALDAVRRSDAAFAAQQARPDVLVTANGPSSPSGEALVQALRMQRNDLLQRLLSAGASPIAKASGYTTPLAVAANPGEDRRRSEGETLSATDRQFFSASVDSFLKVLTPAQIRDADTLERSPLRGAISPAQGRWDSALVNKLVAAGFSLGKLSLDHLSIAITAGDTALAMAMLDAGIANQRFAAPADSAPGLRDNEAEFANAILLAASAGQSAVLDRLMAMRKPGAALSAAELAMATRLAGYGNVEALKLLQSRGWVMDRAMNQPALDSMQPDVIDLVLKSTGSSLAGLCISDGSGFDLPPLVDALYKLDDAAWQQLLALGVARLPGCAAEPSEERVAPTPGRKAVVGNTPGPLPMTTLAMVVLSDPFAVSGLRKERLIARIAQLRQQGMQKADFSNDGAAPLLSRAAGEAALRPVLEALEAPAQVKAPAGAAASRPARWVGNYRLNARGEAAVNLRLKADGRFEWSMSYGASDRFAQGQWHEAGGKVVFASDPTPPFNWFTVTGQTQYDDGPDTGQPFTLLADVGQSRLSDNIHTQVQAGVDEVRELRLEPDIGSTFTLNGQPRVAALWFPEMEAVLASEVALPDLPRLKSVTLTLQPPQQARTMPFNEVMRADAEGLHQGDSVYEKSK